MQAQSRDQIGVTHRNGAFPRLVSVFPAALLVLLVVAVFAQVGRHEFVNFDDRTYIHQNPSVRDGLSRQSVRQAFAEPWAAYWIPLTWISLAVDRTLWGEWAGGFALENAALHALATILWAVFLVRATGRRWPSYWVAAVFAVHPLQVESVAWISQRKDVLSTVFWMLALLLWWRHVQEGGWKWRLGALGVFTLGVLTKLTVVTLPVVLLLLDYWPFRRFGAAERVTWKGLWQALVEKLPFFAVSAVGGLLVLYTQTTMGAREMVAVVPLGTRLAVAAESFLHYLRSFFWPVGLSPVYPLPLETTSWWMPAASLLLVLAVTALVIRVRRRYPFALAAWGWFIVTLLPVIGIFHVGIQARADRWMHLPMIGLAVLMAWCADRWVAGRAARIRLVSSVALASIVALSVAAHHQVGYWRDTITLFERAVAVTSDNYYAHERLAQEYRAAGREEQALEHYFETIYLLPFFARPQQHVAEILASRGNLEAARILSSHASTVRWADPGAEPRTAVALVRAGLDEQALRLLDKALKRRPESAELQSAKAMVLRGRGDLQGAVHHWAEALRIEPRLYSSAGQLAWIRATSPNPDLRDPNWAVTEAQRVIGDVRALEPFLLDVLAAAYAAQGRFQEATATAEEALDLSRARGLGGFVAGLEQRLAAYRAGRMWVEAPGAEELP